MSQRNIVIYAFGAVALIGGIIWYSMMPSPQYGHRTAQRTPECEEMSSIMLGRCTGKAKNISSPHCALMRAEYAKICR